MVKVQGGYEMTDLASSTLLGTRSGCLSSFPRVAMTLAAGKIKVLIHNGDGPLPEGETSQTLGHKQLIDQGEPPTHETHGGFFPIRGSVVDNGEHAAIAAGTEANFEQLTAEEFNTVSQLSFAACKAPLNGRQVKPDNQLGNIKPLADLLSGGDVSFAIEIDPRLLAVDIDITDFAGITSLVQSLQGDGFNPVVFASGQPGRRHVWCLMDDPQALDHYRSQIAGRSGWDDRQVIRPPGIPHRLGFQPEILWGADSWDEVSEMLTPNLADHPSEQEMWSRHNAAMRAAQQHNTRAAQSQNRQISDPAKAERKLLVRTNGLSKRMRNLIATGNAANARLCFRTGTRDHHNKCSTLQHTGRVSGKTCYSSTSEAVQAVLTAAVQCGWTLDRTRSELQAGNLWRQVLQSERGRRSEFSLEKWLTLSWSKAEEFVAARPFTTPDNSQALNAVLHQAEIACALTPMPRSTIRAVFLAHIEAARTARTAVGYVAPGDTTAINASVGSRNTVFNAETWLIDNGFLELKWVTNSVKYANRWQINITKSHSDIMAHLNKHPDAGTFHTCDDPSHDVWRRQGLGKAVWEVSWMLRRNTQGTATQLAASTGRDVSTIRKALKKLRGLALLTDDAAARNRVWFSHTEPTTDTARILDRQAVLLQTAGRRTRARQQQANNLMRRDMFLAACSQRATKNRESLQAGHTPEGSPRRCLTKPVRRRGEPLSKALDRARQMDRMQAAFTPTPVSLS